MIRPIQTEINQITYPSIISQQTLHPIATNIPRFQAPLHEEIKEVSYNKPFNLSPPRPPTDRSGNLHRSGFSDRRDSVIDALTMEKSIIGIGYSTKNISMARTRSISTKSESALLCICSIKDDLVAIGTKQGSILLYKTNGSLIGKLTGHRAAICTLCTTIF